jgi:hypothetical protein
VTSAGFDSPCLASTAEAQSTSPRVAPPLRDGIDASDLAPGIVTGVQALADEAATKAAALEAARLRERPPGPSQLDWDATYYRLDILVRRDSLRIDGTTRAEGRVVATSIDLVDLDFASAGTVVAVRSAGAPTTFTHADDVITVDLERTYTTGELFAIEVDYFAEPDYPTFQRSEFGGNPVIYTLSQPFGAREWWPCKDWPADKADSVDVHCTVDSDLVVAGNGLLRSVTPAGNRHTYHWHESYPIVTYLVSLAIHSYEQYSLWYAYSPTDSMEIQCYHYPGHYALVEEEWGRVPRMMEIFVGLFGEYPFLDEKYGHAECDMGGGMEHQTCTSIGVLNETLIAHELAHMWWGDYITCETFHDIWLNEGFATYGAALYFEEEYGEDLFHQYLDAIAYYGPGSVYVYDLSDPYVIFDHNLTYYKAAWLLHMLRHMVGDAVFLDILSAYYTQYANSTINTEQFRALAESVSGRDLTSFFERWVYGEGFPVYIYDWSAVDLGGSWEVSLTVEQLQTVGLFDMPIDFEVELVGGGTELHQVENNMQLQEYTLVVGGEPVAVRLDPDNWLLDQHLVPVSEPTLDEGILLVNAAPWSSGGTYLRYAYEDRAFWGEHEIDFWDLFDEPYGGYPSTLPAPLGHGVVDPAVVGHHSSVIWVCDDVYGTRDLWLESPTLSYLRAGGNMLFLGRSGSSFLVAPLADYLGVSWSRELTMIIEAISSHPGLVDMPRIGSHSMCSTFDMYDLGPETTLLFTDTQFEPDEGVGAWRTNPGDGGEFVFVSGRPHFWDRSALHDNCDFVLRELFGEGGATAVGEAQLAPRFTLRLGHASPNPMNPWARVPFEMPAAGPATISVYDVAGRLVRELAAGTFEAGPQSVIWDGRNASGTAVGSGVYYIRLKTPAGQHTTSLTIVR